MAFEFKLPDIGEGMVEGEIVHWLVQEGDYVNEDQPLVEVMTDKATVEIPSPLEGRILKRIGGEGETVKVGATLVVIESDAGEPAPEKKAPAPAPEKKAPVQRAQAGVLATPAVRKMARELGIDLGTVKGTGPAGRITEEDLRRHSNAVPPKIAEVPSDKIEIIPYRGLRKKIGDHLVLSKTTAPHFTYVEELDATELIQARKEALDTSTTEDVKITYLPFIMKAVVEGLRQYPLMNSTLDTERGVIQIKRYYNIGIATATPEGLVVPVVKDVDKKNVLQLAREIAELSTATREGKIKLEDLKDGTFTITSLGALGGVLATPILNYPEVAILGVHRISPKVVVYEGQIAIREMMYLSLSLDHRVVDGVIGAQFLQHVIARLTAPGSLSV